MVLLIIIPMKNGYFIGNINPTFSDKPKFVKMEYCLILIYIYYHILTKSVDDRFVMFFPFTMSLWCIPIFGQIHSCLHLAPFLGGIYWTKYSSTMEYRDLDLRELEAHGGYYGICFPIKHRAFPMTCWIATWATLYIRVCLNMGDGP